MSDEPNEIIDGLGGTTAVARMLNAPMSTVHSWRKNGIPPSRLAHLKLAVQVEGLDWPIDTVTPAPTSPGKGDDLTASQQTEAA